MPGLVPSFTIPFLVTVFFIAALRPTARYIGLVDRPGGRKTHHGDVPLVGGICMLAGLLLGGGSMVPLGIYPSLLIGASFMALVGALDDRFDIHPGYRLVAQCAAGVIAIVGGVQVSSLGEFGGGSLNLGLLAVPFTLLTVMSFTNAFNFQDGGDGLAGGQALISLLSLLVLDWYSGSSEHMRLIVALIGCVVAFLAFNAPFRARAGAYLFMGDAGALFLGFALVWLAILMSQGDDAVIAPVTALWIGGVPLLDFFGSMARRVATGRWPLSGDAEHLHHLLMRAGLMKRKLFIAEMCASSVFATVGLAGHFLQVAQLWMLIAMGVVAGAYYCVFCSGWFFQRQGDPMPFGTRRFYLPLPPLRR